MRRNHAVSIVTAAVLAALAGIAPAAAADKNAIGTATVLGSDGSVKGQMRLTARGSRVELKLTVRGLPAGQHGVHLHTVGSCNAPDFASAGAHLNPAGRMHGTMNPQGPHLGDLPNLSVGSGGTGSLTAMLAGTPAELGPVLFDGDGTALVVHAAGDDYTTDPSGNSGARIACAVLTRIR
jgi:Cu-Zn family superoxide dismutase